MCCIAGSGASSIGGKLGYMATKKKSRAEQRYWLSYDLGVRGNYSGLYEWLDSKGARECGDSLATFMSDRTSDELGKELRKLVNDAKARAYLIGPDQESGRAIGRFVLGKRKSAPWAGYFSAAVDAALDR